MFRMNMKLRFSRPTSLQYRKEDCGQNQSHIRQFTSLVLSCQFTNLSVQCSQNNTATQSLIHFLAPTNPPGWLVGWSVVTSCDKMWPCWQLLKPKGELRQFPTILHSFYLIPFWKHSNLSFYCWWYWFYEKDDCKRWQNSQLLLPQHLPHPMEN